ncbi:hypothetical protein [Streptomyces sp. SA15]|nr:hypothetical protein [Streptomyces sp. SA15]
MAKSALAELGIVPRAAVCLPLVELRRPHRRRLADALATVSVLV